MESKIIQQNKNPFLHREELLFEIKSPSAPTTEEIKKQTNKDQDLIVVKKINTNFGRQTFTAEVHIYDSKEDKARVETIPKKIRLKMAEAEKAQAAKAKEEQSSQPEEATPQEASATDTKSEGKETSEQSLPEEPKAETQEEKSEENKEEAKE